MSQASVAQVKEAADAGTWTDREVRTLVESVVALRDSALYSRFAAVMASEDGAELNPRRSFFQGAKTARAGRVTPKAAEEFWGLLRGFDADQQKRQQLKRQAVKVLGEAMA